MNEQLEEFLNNCIEKGWKNSFFQMYPNFVCESRYIWNGLRYEENIEYSYHDLFSIESGLMEFVRWKGNRNIRAYTFMSNKTAEQKIKYFLENALLPE